MKSGAISIDRYAGGEPAEQFDFLYENFSILQELLKDYREELIMEVIEQKAYNRRSQNGDLGVRIQVSMGISNTTMNKAIEHMTVAQAIDEGLLDEDFFEDTDNKQELIRKVTSYHRVNRDLETFTSKLGTMNPKDQRIIRPYLLREKSMDELAVDLGIDYRSAVKHVYRIKKRLIEKVEPKLTVIIEEEHKIMGFRRTDVEETALYAKKFVRYDEGARKYSMGLSKFQTLAREAKAAYKVDKLMLVNCDLFEKYLETFREY